MNTTTAPAGLACINAKERNKKEKQRRRAKKSRGIEVQRVKSSTPSWATDAPIGDEEQNGKRKKEKEPGSGSPTQLPWTQNKSELFNII